MNDPVLQKVSELLHEVTEALEEPPAMVTNAIVVAEYVDENGEQWLRTFRNAGVRSWQIRGMVGSVLSDLDAGDVVWALEDDS